MSSTALPDYLQLPQDRLGYADSATAVGPSLDEELFPPLRVNGMDDLSNDVDIMNKELRMVAALEARLTLENAVSLAGWLAFSLHC